MIEKKKQLVKLGKALACIGIERESARRDLETLTKQGASYTSSEMLQAVQRFQAAEERWKETEEEYLALRREIVKQ